MVSTTSTEPTWPFLGHAELGRHLIQLADANRLPKVVLFVGPQSLGKSSAARWLVQRDLCQGQSVRPCMVCVACRQVEHDAHPNATVINPAEDESIGADLIRQALQQYDLVSWQAARRWLVIVDAERLTEGAANTMLKFLEETPPYVHVVMTSSHPERLISTLRSRATIYQWHFVQSDETTTRVPADHQRLARAAGRPGWLSTITDLADNQTDLEQAQATAGQLLQTSAPSRERLSKERSVVQEKIGREELVVREILLRSLGSRRRLLWPVQAWTEELTPSAAVSLAEKYLDRYDLAPQVQARLLYEDLHLV